MKKIYIKFLSVIMVLTMITGSLLTNNNTAIVSAASKKPKLNKKSAKLYVGQTTKLKLSNSKKVKWSSSKKSVATVDKKGKVTAKKKGKTIISAKYLKKKYKCTVTVFDTKKEMPAPTDIISQPVPQPTEITQQLPPPNTTPNIVPDIPPIVGTTPTPQPNINNTPKDNFNNLKNYILNNGKTNSDGNKFIKYDYGDYDTYSSSILYDKNEKCFNFITVNKLHLSDNDIMNESMNITIYESDISKANLQFVFVTTNSRIGAKLSCDTALSNIQQNASIVWNIDSSVGVANSDSSNNNLMSLANNCVSTGYIFWDAMLKVYLNINMTNLGFK